MSIERPSLSGLTTLRNVCYANKKFWGDSIVTDSIRSADQEQIIGLLRRVELPLRLDIETSDVRGTQARATLDLVSYLESLDPSGRLHHRLTESRSLPGTRLSIVRAPDNSFPLSFWGTPSGLEFRSLLEALEVAGGSLRPDLDPVTHELLRTVAAEALVSIFVSPT